MSRLKESLLKMEVFGSQSSTKARKMNSIKSVVVSDSVLLEGTAPLVAAGFFTIYKGPLTLLLFFLNLYLIFEYRRDLFR